MTLYLPICVLLHWGKQKITYSVTKVRQASSHLPGYTSISISSSAEVQHLDVQSSIAGVHSKCRPDAPWWSFDADSSEMVEEAANPEIGCLLSPWGLCSKQGVFQSLLCRTANLIKCIKCSCLIHQPVSVHLDQTCAFLVCFLPLNFCS